MGEKRVSMRQIARECGCSLATVSYALNNSGQGKVSSATRLKVIQTAKRLNYSADRTGRVKENRAVILICAARGEDLSRRVELMDLAWELVRQLEPAGIPTSVLKVGDLVEEWGKIRAMSPTMIFVLDGGSRAIAQLDPPCLQPVIFVNSDNSDPLYYKILPDYPYLTQMAAQHFGRSDLFLVSKPVRSGGILTEMTRGIREEDVFLNDGRPGLDSFLEQRRDRCGLVVGDLLAVAVCRRFPPEQLAVVSALNHRELFPPGLAMIAVPNRARAEAAAAVARDLITLDYDAEGKNRILLRAEGVSLI